MSELSSWKKTQQNDYRMADIHNYIALDIPFTDGTLRRKLNIDGWSHNPIYEAKILAEGSTGATKSDMLSPNDVDLDEFSSDFNFKF